MNDSKFYVYDLYDDYRDFLGKANNFTQAKVICEKRIDDTDGECMLLISDNEQKRDYTYYDFLEEYKK